MVEVGFQATWEVEHAKKGWRLLTVADGCWWRLAVAGGLLAGCWRVAGGLLAVADGCWWWLLAVVK